MNLLPSKDLRWWLRYTPANRIGMSQMTTARIRAPSIAKRRWEQHHYNHSRPRGGRPKKLTAIQIVRMNSFINRHRHLTWNDLILELDLNISKRTLQRRLQSYWRRKWRSKRRIALSEDDAKERLEFAEYWIPRIDELLLVNWP